MLAIRLSRVGKKNSAYFRVVVMDKQKSAKGRALEVLGSVNPHKNEVSLKNERILYWISVGAQPSDRVHNILVSNQVIKGPKRFKKIRKSKKSAEGVEEATAAPAAVASEQAPVEENITEKPVEETAEQPEVTDTPETEKVEEPKEEVKEEKAEIKPKEEILKPASPAGGQVQDDNKEEEKSEPEIKEEEKKEEKPVEEKKKEDK